MNYEFQIDLHHLYMEKGGNLGLNYVKCDTNFVKKSGKYFIIINNVCTFAVGNSKYRFSFTSTT